MEQSHAGECHDHAVLIAFLDDQIVPDGAAGLGDVLDAGGFGALDVVGEGEASIGTEGNAVKFGQEFPLVFFRQPVGLAGEVVLPDAVGADVLLVAVDVAVDHVVPVGAAEVGAEGQGQGLGVLAQEEGVGLGAGQPGAVDAGLLTRAHAHGLPVIGEAHGVGLGVFQGDERHDQVDLGGFGQIFILGDDVLKQMPVDLEVVPPLLEGDAEDLLRLLLGGNALLLWHKPPTRIKMAMSTHSRSTHSSTCRAVLNIRSVKLNSRT